MRKSFVLAGLAHASLNLASSLLVHLPGYLQDLGASEADIGRLMAAQAAGALLVWPLVGPAMDARGRRVVIATGALLYAVAAGWYASIQTLGPAVYAARLLDGIAVMMWYTALFTYAADLVPETRRVEGLAIFGLSGLLPLGLGAQFGDVILARASYRELFLGGVAFSAAAAALCVPLRTSSSEHRRLLSVRGLVAAAHTNLLPVWAAAFAFFVAVAALFGFMKTFVIAGGAGRVGSFFVTYALTAASLRILLGWLPDTLGPRRTLAFAMSSYAAGLIVLAFIPESSILAAVLCGAGHGYTFPVLLSLVVTRADTRQRGVATAFFTALDWLGHLVAGPFVGHAIEAVGYAGAFAMLAVLLATGLGVFQAFDRPAGLRP